MNNEQDNQRTDNKRQPMKYQQFVPGFPIGPPGQRQPQQDRPGTPIGPPGQRQPQQGRPGSPIGPPGQRQPQQDRPGTPIGPPGQRQPQQDRPGSPPDFGPRQPPSAPPRFTPQLPREEEQPLLSGPTGFREPYGGRIIDLRRRTRDFRGCLNRFTYIWLINGNNFWFYPVFVGRNTIEGFRWRRNRWEYDRILTNRVLFHLCF